MERLKDHIAHRGQRRATRPRRRPMAEDFGEVQTIRSLGLEAASVALPAGIDLEDRAARMNAFWKKLIDFQHSDVVVVALCATEEQ